MIERKPDFCGEDHQLNNNRDEKIFHYFCRNIKEWDEERIRQTFHNTEVSAILVTSFPQNYTVDRLTGI